MTEKEEKALRSVYQQWPVERLAHATTIEKGEYRPEALAVMLDELKKRGVEAENLSVLSKSFSPWVPPPERNTFLLPARLNRKQYAIRWLLSSVFFMALGVLLSLVSMSDELRLGAASVWLIGIFLYRIIGLYVPRLKNAGLSPWLALLIFVPLANFILFVMLFVLPPKKEEKANNNAQNAPALTSAGSG